MARYVTSNTDRNQINLIPVSLEELISEDNLARVIDIFTDSLDFANNARKKNLTKGKVTKMLAHFEQSAEQ